MPLNGAFADLDGIPPGDGTNDVGLPQPNLTISNLDLTASADVADPAGGDLWEYTNDNDLLIDFGSRNVERNGIAGFQPGETGNLSLTVPAGDTFDVLFTVTDGIEIDFADTNGFFTFVPDGGAELPSNNETVIAPADVDLIADSVGELAGYEIQGIADIPWHIPGQDIVDGGTAFAYAESTSALDLS